MDGPSHFRTAEDYLLLASEEGDADGGRERDYMMARATAHGALALVAAMIDTAFEVYSNEDKWREAIAHE